MSRLFLTSSLQPVAADLAIKLGSVTGKKLALIGTAMECLLDQTMLASDRQVMSEIGFSVLDYTITGKTAGQIKSDLNAVDVIYFSGGNYLYLLHQIQISQSADVFRDLVTNHEKIFIGTSSGSIIAGPNLFPLYFPRLETQAGIGKLTDYTGLGLVDFTIFPHWGKPDFKKNYFDYILDHAYTSKEKIILLSDNQYVRVVGDTYQIVSV